MTGHTASAAGTSALSESTPNRYASGLPPGDTTSGDAAGMATATIQDASGSYSPGSERAVSSREQRFNELLRATVTTGATADPASQASASTGVVRPPAPTPVRTSPVARLVAPVSNALTGNSSSNNQSSINQPSTDHARDTTNPREHDRPKEKDDTSDTTAPHLVGLMFDPPTVHDGQETVLTAIATDDLSGVRNISGSITSPTGKALQGFALQPSGANDNRFFGRIALPKDAEEGLWRINFLSLSDNASNTQNLNFAQGNLPASAQFHVVSERPDSTPPTVKAVWLDRPAISSNEKVTVFVTAEDDKSGVNLVSGVFQSPSKFARIGFGCRPGNGTTWQCDVTPPKCTDCGNWQLEQIQLQDKANNMATVRIDNPLVGAVKLNVTGDSCDSTPPAMTSLELDPLFVSNVDASTVTLTAFVSDDQCGVSSVSGQAAGPTVAGQQPPRLYFSFMPSTEGQWSGKLIIPKLASKGEWSIVWIQVLDKGNNLKTYSQSDPTLAMAKFTVK
ncbi:MAG: hypothetical protein JWO56_1521, partial [Acidobacteria bacterium]|nr:hypothetical protein [Acidobacteriota bacterium]